MLKTASLSLAAIVALAGAVGCGHESEEASDLDGPSAVTPAAVPSSSEPTASPAPAPSATPPPAGTTVAYEPDVRAVVEAHCTRCHGGFSTYRGVMLYVRPGDATSPLLQATGSGGPMARYLATPAEADLLRQWVLAGAPERR